MKGMKPSVGGNMSCAVDRVPTYTYALGKAGTEERKFYTTRERLRNDGST
jgi:hypothetical protein